MGASQKRPGSVTALLFVRAMRLTAYRGTDHATRRKRRTDAVFEVRRQVCRAKHGIESRGAGYHSQGLIVAPQRSAFATCASLRRICPLSLGSNR
jgi:hypothetical protein